MSVSYFKTSSQSAFTGVAVTVGPVEWITAFPGSTAKVLFRQKFQQDIDSWTALSLSTLHGTLTGYVLVKEDDFQAIGGGQQTWSRYYATTPPERIEFTTYAAQFPGYQSIRSPINATSAAKITYNYFLIDNPGGDPGLNLAGESVVTLATGEATPLLSSVYLSATTATRPTISTYNSFVIADKASSGSFSITAEAQTLTRWEGNFYERRTLNIKAK